MSLTPRAPGLWGRAGPAGTPVLLAPLSEPSAVRGEDLPG